MKPRLFVVHGYQAQIDSHWFQWLCQQFPDVETHIVALPDPHHPQLSAWLSALQAAIGQVDEQTFIVAHSLGCVTTLRFLSEQTEAAALGGLVLVAGFAEPLVNLPELNGFNREALHWSAVRKRSHNCLKTMWWWRLKRLSAWQMRSMHLCCASITVGILCAKMVAIPCLRWRSGSGSIYRSLRLQMV